MNVHEGTVSSRIYAEFRLCVCDVTPATKGGGYSPKRTQTRAYPQLLLPDGGSLPFPPVTCPESGLGINRSEALKRSTPHMLQKCEVICPHYAFAQIFCVHIVTSPQGIKPLPKRDAQECFVCGTCFLAPHWKTTMLTHRSRILEQPKQHTMLESPT